VSASEKTLYNAMLLFSDPNFRAERAVEFPSTMPLCDAKAATFATMDAEGRFEETIGQPMTFLERAEFVAIAEAVIKLSNYK
jgi:hypothetical protein